MGSLNQGAMDALLADGILTLQGVLTDNQKLYLKPPAITTCSILEAIYDAGPSGLNVEQIKERTQHGHNTVFVYTRYLVDKQFLLVQFIPSEEHGGAYNLYRSNCLFPGELQENFSKFGDRKRVSIKE